MITVDEALAQLFALVTPLDPETVPLANAASRVLALDVQAKRDQPPFAASAMDGYAVAGGSPACGATFDVIGEAAAGHGFCGPVGAGQAVRIFTGAPVPDGATRVIIQEDVSRAGDQITLTVAPGDSTNIRPAGGDFRSGDILAAPRWISPQDVALLASMSIAQVPVIRPPEVALISTGDELVMPGETPGPDQIIVSNTFGLSAMLAQIGAKPRMLPIARDNVAALESAFDLARGADLVLTIGGASVGDHDLVGDVAAGLGLQRSFYKVAMRPGKPLMAGRMGDAVMIGLPGNPVSAMVCGHVFVAPVIRAMLGLGTARAARLTAPLAADLPANGPREHYMRAKVLPEGLKPFERQDSSLLKVLANANALLIRPQGDGPRRAGEQVDYLPL